MLVVRTSECRANPICQLVGTQQTVRLDHLPLAVNPFGLYRIEPWASLGQQTGDYPHSPPTLLDSPVVRSDPTPDLAAYVPACVLPDENQHLLASSLELLRAPSKKARGYSAHRATVHKTQPRLFDLGHIQPVAGDGLRIGVVFRHRLLYQTQRPAFFAKAVQVRLRRAGPPALVLKT